MQKIILKIEGMSCSACSNHIEKYLKKQKGIIDAYVNLIMGNVLIHYEDDINVETLGQYINASGYKYAGIYEENEENKKDNQKIYLIILGFLMIFIMYVTMGHMLKLPQIPYIDMMHPINYALFSFFMTIPYLFYGRDIIIRGIKNLFSKSANMDTLVAIGIIISFIYSFVNMLFILQGQNEYLNNLYFESVCMIVLFIKIGRYIDKNSKEKTKEALKGLVQVTPLSALLKTKNGEKEITIDEVKVGDILIARPGMKVAVDGHITKGSAHFDESFITGESKPTKKEKNDFIVAGAINYDGVVEYKAEKIGPNSTISEMVHLVLEASNSKMPISRIVDKVSSYFVPIIFLLAFLTFIIYFLLGNPLNTCIIHMVNVLVVACPCSLGLATPLAIVTSIGTAARANILIKASEALEIAANINTIVFDKTGTLTYGQLKIAKFYNYSNYSDQDFLNLVANIESNSNHPIAKAFTGYKRKNLKCENYQEIAGLGIKTKVNNKHYCLGNKNILKNIENDYQKLENKLAHMGCSIVYVREENTIIGLIGIKDVVKKDAKDALKNIRKLGVDIIMLTGDNDITASIIGKELGIENVAGGLMPQDKTKYIKELQQKGKKVAMVGDGINDAPSLVTADIGISFKNSTDIATNSANVIITSDNLNHIGMFLNLGKKTLRNIKQNLFWAFSYNILMIPIAMGLFKKFNLEINPMIASFSMMMSSLCVVFNSLRLKKIK